MANADVERYQNELSSLEKNGFFMNKKGEDSRDLYLKENSPKPQKVLSAYIYFASQNIKALKEKHPNLKNTDLMKKNGLIWNSMTESEKSEFI